jgi:hypothetical protein
MYQSDAQSGATRDPDQLAIERYRYLLQTAPPDTIERAHEEAFAQLTPAQRRIVLDGLARETEPAELRGVTDDPRDLARLATRTELRRPGTIERVFGGEGGHARGLGFGGGFAGFLPILAGAFLGTAIANTMFGGAMDGFGGTSDAAAAEGIGSGADGDPGGRAFGGEWGEAGGGAEGDAGGLDADIGGGFDGDFGDFGGF